MLDVLLLVQETFPALSTLVGFDTVNTDHVGSQLRGEQGTNVTDWLTARRVFDNLAHVELCLESATFHRQVGISNFGSNEFSFISAIFIKISLNCSISRDAAL